MINMVKEQEIKEKVKQTTYNVEFNAIMEYYRVPVEMAIYYRVHYFAKRNLSAIVTVE